LFVCFVNKEGDSNSIQLKKVNDVEIEYNRVEKLYEETFLAEERQPFWILKRRAKQGKAEQWNIYNEETWIGWIYIIKLNGKNCIYIYYFAIDPQYRGKGYGTKVLKLILEKYKEYKIILALEDWKEDTEDQEQRIKRHNFYKKFGFKDLPYKQQEPYISFPTMSFGGEVKPDEFKDLIDSYFGWPLKYIYNWNLV